jgi:hypothetical protein
MKTEVMIYEGNEIEFSFEEKNGTMMVNATEMAKIFGKQVNEFTSSPRTGKFINAICKSENFMFNNIIKTGNSRFLTEDDLIISRQKSGTWMHRVLALKFAAWLDSDFEVWVYTTIESLLFGNYVRRDESFRRTLQLQARMEELELKAEKTPDFDEYLNLKRQLKAEQANRRSLTVMELQGLEQKTLFE